MIQTEKLTFRIFVSSTFKDFLLERSALQERVFPRLEAFCASQGAKFQAVDLRWGVSERASLDQQTMKICLDEIRRCQEITPRPNFLVLLGDRYGWCPPPPEIPCSEFEAIQKIVEDEELSLLHKWYRLDENAVPPLYCLQPRQKGTKFQAIQTWEPIEHKLWEILSGAVQELDLNENELMKYQASATHQEIAAGALSVEDAQDHVFGFIRRVPDMPEDKRAADFRDLTKHGQPDQESRQRLDSLKADLDDHLRENLSFINADWQEDRVTDTHLDGFCDQVFECLTGVIQRELEQQQKKDPLEEEILEQRAFLSERARFFTGRPSYIHRITKETSAGTLSPLVLWGKSGSGKSALLARCAQLIPKEDPESTVISRFIGATPDSTRGAFLLRGLCQEIYNRCHFEDQKASLLDDLPPGEKPAERRRIEQRYQIPTSYLDLSRCFKQFIAMVNPDLKLFIFVDALDQLSPGDPARGYSWVPRELPAGVQLILSVLPGSDLEILQQKLPQDHFLELQLMDERTREELLDRWMGNAGRKLKPDQRHRVIQACRQDPRPLFLKLAFEESRRWKSYTPPEDQQLGNDIQSMVRTLFRRLSNENLHGKQLVSRSLAYLGAAKNGLSEDELLDLLSEDKEVMEDFFRRSPQSPRTGQLPVVVWSRLYHDLAPYLMWRAADGTRLMNFFHRQIDEVVRADNLTGKAGRFFHKRIAGYFGDQPIEKAFESKKAPNLRKFSELPYQLSETKEWESLQNTLTDIKFLYSKFRAAGLDSVLDDFRFSRENGCPSESLVLLEDALRLSHHTLNSSPREFPTQLTGRLAQADHSQITAFLTRLREELTFPWLRPLSPALSPAGSPLRMILAGHAGAVTALIFIDQGRYLVSGGQDSTIRIWDPETGDMVHGWKGSLGGPIDTLAISSDERYLASGDSGKIWVWDLPARLHDRKLGKPIVSWIGHDATITTLKFSPDDKFLISGSHDHTLKKWVWKSKTLFKTLQPRQGKVWHASIEDQGKKLISVTRNHSLQIWDLTTHHELDVITGEPARVELPEINVQQCRIIPGAGDHGALVWDEDHGCRVPSLGPGRNPVRDLSISRDGKHLAAVTENTLLVWNLDDKKLVSRVQSSQGAKFSMIKFSPGGSILVSAMSDHSLRIWDIEACLGHLNEEREGDKSLTAPFCDSYGIYRRPDQSLWAEHLWSEDRQFKTPNPDLQIFGVTASPGGRMLLILFKGAPGQILDTWNGTWRELPRSWSTGLSFASAGIAITPDAEFIIFGCTDGNLRIMDSESGEILREMGRHEGEITELRITDDGRFAVTAGTDRSIRIWDIPQGLLLRTIKEVRSPIITSPEAEVIISKGGRAALDNAIHISTFQSGYLKHRLEGHATMRFDVELTGLAVSGDGKYLASCARDQTLRLWDLSSGEQLAEFHAEEKFTTCAFSDRDFTLFAGYETGKVDRFSLENVAFNQVIVAPIQDKVVCPSCAEVVSVQATEPGERLSCPSCLADFVLSSNPPASLTREILRTAPKSPPKKPSKAPPKAQSKLEIMVQEKKGSPKVHRGPSLDDLLSKKTPQLPGKNDPPLPSGKKKPPTILGPRRTPKDQLDIFNKLSGNENKEDKDKD